MTKEKIVIPDWAVSDEDAKELIPESGFIRDYMLYMRECTDAPLIYHYGTITTIMSCVTSRSDIYCQPPEGREKGRSYVLGTPIWSALIGISGAARKSSCMNGGIRILKRALGVETDTDVYLPSDGSLEGWHDFMCEHNEVLLHRDEMSVLFDQAKRGYSEGLKNWLMEIHSGHPKRRATRKDQAAKEEKIIERPRFAILGGIPPEVFAKVAGIGDWNSGFLARFAFWPSERGYFNRYYDESKDKEARMAKWLYNYAWRLNGYIYIPHECRERLMDWFEDNVEDVRQSLPSGLYSHFVRYQDLGLRLAAMHAVSRPRTRIKDQVTASLEDMEHAIYVLTIIQKTTMALFTSSGREPEREAEDDIINILRKAGKPMKMDDLLTKCSMSRTTLFRRLKTLAESGNIRAKKDSARTAGRRPILYSA